MKEEVEIHSNIYNIYRQENVFIFCEFVLSDLRNRQKDPCVIRIVDMAQSPTSTNAFISVSIYIYTYIK